MNSNTPHKPGTFNFEMNIFRYLRDVYTTLSGGLSVTIVPAVVVAVPTLSRVTSSGTVAAGAKSVSIANTGAADALVLGTVLKPTESVSFSTSFQGETLGAVSYDPQTSELLISKIV